MPAVADTCFASIGVATRIFKIDVAGIPTALRVVAACERLDAFAKTQPDRQVGAPAACRAVALTPTRVVPGSLSMPLPIPGAARDSTQGFDHERPYL